MTCPNMKSIYLYSTLEEEVVKILDRTEGTGSPRSGLQQVSVAYEAASKRPLAGPAHSLRPNDLIPWQFCSVPITAHGLPSPEGDMSALTPDQPASHP